MAGEHINVLGSVIAVELPAQDRARIRAQWSRCMAFPGSAAVSSVTYSTQDDVDRRDYALASALTLAGIQHAAGTRLMLHAAGVADPASGAVAALIAASGTGKTTAAHRLCREGFGYVTDETVSIGADHGVLPYPKPLSLVIDGDSPHHKSQHGPDELGLAACPPDPHAALFVLLDRAGDGPAEPALEQLPLLDGLLELIPQSSALPAMARPLWSLATAVHTAGGVWRLRYREIADVAPLLRDALCGHRADPSDIAQPTPARPDDRPGRPVASDATQRLTAGSLVTRAPYLDAVCIDDEVLVLVERRPARLSGLGSTIWRHSARPTAVGELTRRCIDEHGDHEAADRLVTDAVSALIEHTVLQLA